MSQGDTFLSPSSGADPRVGMVLSEKYRVVRKLGEGGMGAVYEGEHTLIKRRVAIKCLHAQFAQNPEIVARFHREAMAATSIGHPNIVEVTDMGRFPDGAFYMVLEFLDGRDWAKDIEKTGPQSLGRMVHIMSQVCDALEAAHAKGVVHRDLKPENIYLIKRGSDDAFVKVLDFGISKVSGEGESKGLTRTGTAMGTPYYMAPEQAQGKRDVDSRADIYSLGVIIFQALTGQYPFDDESYPMLVLKICTEAPPALTRFRPDLPVEVEHLVNSMLAKKPADRPANCGEIKAALERWRAVHDAPIVAADAPSTASLGASVLGGPAGPAATANMGGAGTPIPVPTGTPPTNVAGPHAHTGPIAQRNTLTPLSASNTPVGHESSPALPTTSRTPLYIGAGLGAVGVIGAIVGVMMFGGGGGASTSATSLPVPPAPPTTAVAPPSDPTPVAPPAPTTPTAVEAPTPTEVARVTVQITTEPDDAEVYLDDGRIPNPFDGDLPQSSETHTLRVQRDGYTTTVQDLVLSVPQRVRVRLRRGHGVEDRSTAGRRRGGTAAATPPQETGAVAATPTPTPTPTPPVTTPEPPPATPPPRDPPAEEPRGASASLKNPFGR